MQYFDPSLDAQTFAEIGPRLVEVVQAAEPELRAISEPVATRPLAAGKWAPKQVLGHLIDSAANNHQRFVRAIEADTLRSPGYSQEHWVRAQHYEDRPWLELVALWAAYNRHLGHVIERLPEQRRSTRCEIGANEPVPLSHIALDYVGHQEHHLRQILGRR